MKSSIRFLRTRSSRRGFTLVEILVGLLVVAALAGGAIFVVTKVNQSATDTQKTENAKKMTDMMIAYWQAGGDMTAVGTTPADVIGKLSGTPPLQIPSPIELSAPMTIYLPAPLPNSAAYNYSYDATTGPRFSAILGQANVRP